MKLNQKLLILLWNHRRSWGINVRDFVGNPCPRISIPIDKYTYKHFLNMY